MKDSFYVVLPSNSSMNIYPENTTTRYMTYLPQQIHLTGEWEVALTEVHIPLTFQHLKPDDEEVKVVFFQNLEINYIRYLSPGVYKELDSLIHELNSLDPINTHLKFSIDCGCYVEIALTCQCESAHTLIMESKLKKIFGFENLEGVNEIIMNNMNRRYRGKHPANLLNGLPNFIMIYTNILEHQTTGDVRTPLLRTFPLDLHHFTYGSFAIKNFAQPMYLPLLPALFRSIEIDIRDQFGKPIPFDYGTLTVTLHFKRAN